MIYPPMMEVRLRSRISKEEMDEKVGKIVTDDDYNLLLTRKIRVYQPDGRLLCVYLPGVLTQELAASYEVLHELRKFQTNNRGLASGSKRVQHAGRTRTEAMTVASAIIGAFDPNGPRTYCRLTAWTGREWDKWSSLFPLFQRINGVFRENVPDRYAAQAGYAAKTRPEWVIPGTAFTTITVNNSYSTGVHKDAGDLDEGFSCLAVHRRGKFSGAVLTFPEFRVGVSLQDGDLILMDAHQWHSNTAIVKESEDAERISVVCYYRTKMTSCGTGEEEVRKAQLAADRLSKLADDEEEDDSLLKETVRYE